MSDDASVYAWSDKIPDHPCWFFVKGPKELGVRGGKRITVGRVIKDRDHAGNSFLCVLPDFIVHERKPGLQYAEIPDPFTDIEVRTDGAMS